MTAPPDTPLLQFLADQFLISSESVNSTALLGLMATNPQMAAWQELVQAEIDHAKGRHDAGLSQVRRLLDHPDPAIRGRAHVLMARFETNAGHGNNAHQHTNTALDILHTDDTVGRAFATMLSGRINLETGDHMAATRDLQAAQQGFAVSNHLVGQSKVLRMLAAVALNHGHIGDVDDWLDQAEAVYRQAGWAVSATFPFYRGQAAYFQGQFAKALILFDQSLILAKAADDQATVAYIRYTCGWCHLRRGDVDSARSAFTEALRWSHEANQADLTADIQLGMAEAALQSHDISEYRRWSDMVRDSQSLPETHHVRIALRLTEHRLWMHTDRWDEAWTSITDFLHDLDEQLRPSLRYEALKLKGWIAAALLNRQEADAAREASTALQRVHGFDFLPDTWQPTESGPPDRPTVDIRCFDTFTVTIAEHATMPNAWRGHRVKLLLALLLLEPGGITKEVLIERLYPKQRAARSAIPVLVKRLRQALDGEIPASANSLILWQKGRYQLNPAMPIHCDLWQFEQAWQDLQTSTDDDGRVSACRTIIAAYCGPLFVGFHDEPGIVVAHQRVHRQWQDAYQWLQTWTLREKGASAALELADAQLAQDPAAEATHGFKIRTLLELGRKQEARQQYHTLVQCLKETTGMTPNPESVELLNRLEGGSP